MPFSCSMIGTPARHAAEHGRPPTRALHAGSATADVGTAVQEDLRPSLRMLVTGLSHGPRHMRLSHS
jgi:hypothetical protein